MQKSGDTLIKILSTREYEIYSCVINTEVHHEDYREIYTVKVCIPYIDPSRWMVVVGISQDLIELAEDGDRAARAHIEDARMNFLEKYELVTLKLPLLADPKRLWSKKVYLKRSEVQ